MIKLYTSSLLLFIMFILFGNHLYDKSAYELQPNKILTPPSLENPLGTDRLGRDILARILEGGKMSLYIGFTSSLITSVLGLIIGIHAGYFKGYIDKSVVIAIDLFLTFPSFFLLLTLVTYINASSFVLIIVLSVTGWMSMARLIRSESFAISDKPYVKILKLSSVNTLKIMLKYYAPLISPIFLVAFTFGVGGAILSESALSYLGLGINPPHMSWGSILSHGKEVIDIAWWISFFSGFCIFLVTFCLIQISEYLQHTFNTKQVQKI